MISKAKEKRNGTADAHLVPAVSYIRMSTDQQEDSPAQQREHISKLAKDRGYRIVHEYADPGISGAETKKRPQFLKMIADADSGEYQAILLWDLNRFARLNSIEAGRFLEPLYQHRIKLVSVTQREIDLGTMEGRIMVALLAEVADSDRRSKVLASMRGTIRSAQLGNWMGQPPYGFDREYYEGDTMVKRVAYNEKFKSPDAWKCRLAQNDDSKTIKWILTTYAETDTSVHAIAQTLNRRGVPAPRGGNYWCEKTIRHMLVRTAYYGASAYGTKVGNGKLFRISASGEIEESRQPEQRDVPAIVCEGTHKGVISKEMHDAILAKFLGRRRRGSNVKANRYVLSGILRCGHCGCPMSGRTQDGIQSYVCSSKNYGVDCRTYYIRGEAVEPFVLSLLVDSVLSPERIEAFKAKLLAKAKQRHKAAPGDSKGIKAKIAGLDRDIKRGTDNLLRADPDDFEDAAARLREWREQRDSLRDELDSLEASQTAGKGDPAKMVEKAVKRLLSLRADVLRAENAVRLRHIYKTLIERIDLFWEPRSSRKKNPRFPKMRFKRGSVRVRDNSLSELLGTSATRCPQMCIQFESGDLSNLGSGDYDAAEYAVDGLCRVHAELGRPVKSAEVAEHLGREVPGVHQNLLRATRRGMAKRVALKPALWVPVD